MDKNSRQISQRLQNGAPVTTQVGAYNTYIGARYVPLIDGDWSATKNYEPLTIVTYQGNSYTSKQYVPAGILPTDESYWALTGNFNGQIAGMQNKIDSNTAEIESINTDITQIEGDIASIEADIKALDIKVFPKSRKIVCFSDSYGTQTVNWTTKLGDNNPNYSIQNYSVSGIGFSATPNSQNMEQYISSIAATIDKDNVTDVIFICGTNDIKVDYIAGLQGKVVSCINYVKTLFPDANIWVGFCGVATATLPNPNITTGFSSYMNACSLSGAKFIDSLVPIVYDLSQLQSDEVHPNSTGANTIAQALNNYLNGGTFKYVNSKVLTVASANSSGLRGEIYQCIDGYNFIWESSTMYFDSISFKGYSNSGDSLIEVGSIPDIIIREQGDSRTTIRGMIKGTETGAFLGELLFAGSTIYIRGNATVATPQNGYFSWGSAYINLFNAYGKGVEPKPTA